MLISFWYLILQSLATSLYLWYSGDTCRISPTNRIGLITAWSRLNILRGSVQRAFHIFLAPNLAYIHVCTWTQHLQRIPGVCREDLNMRQYTTSMYVCGHCLYQVNFVQFYISSHAIFFMNCDWTHITIPCVLQKFPGTGISVEAR